MDMWYVFPGVVNFTLFYQTLVTWPCLFTYNSSNIIYCRPTTFLVNNWYWCGTNVLTSLLYIPPIIKHGKRPPNSYTLLIGMSGQFFWPPWHSVYENQCSCHWDTSETPPQRHFRRADRSSGADSMSFATDCMSVLDLIFNSGLNISALLAKLPATCIMNHSPFTLSTMLTIMRPLLLISITANAFLTENTLS